ncbi:MAG: hypothetical protein KGN02_07080 [bacterium]|nr:hypothetical protein [bacterium]
MDDSAKTLEINGHRIAPGELAFMYRPEHGDFLFGNIEDVVGGNAVVSFEKDSWERRDPAIFVSLADVHVAQDVNARVPGAGYRYTAKEWVFKRTGVMTAEPLVVLASQEAVGDPLLVVPVRFANDKWVVAGDACAVATGDIFHPMTLCVIQRYRFCSPVHPLFDIVRQPVGLSMDAELPCVLHLDGIDIPVRNQMVVRGHEISYHLTAHYTLVSLLGNLAGRRLLEERLAPIGEVTPRWSATVASTGVSTNFSGGDFNGSISVIPRSLEATFADEPVVATAEIYTGAPMEAWSSRVSYREEPINMALIAINYGPIPNATQFECFGKHVIITKAHRHGGVDVDYLSVIRIGEPLSKNDHAVLSAFIGYITGGRAANVLTETYAHNRKLRTVIHDRAEPTVRKQPPVPIVRPWLYSRLITNSFAKVLDSFKSWRETDERSFEALFHHYSEGAESSYPVTKTLKLAVAFEAFVNLVTLDNAVNEKIVDNNDDYNALKAELSETLREYASNHRRAISETAEERFHQKFDEGFNLGSNTKRINKFWELVPIVVSKKDKKRIHNLRNDVVHRGFIGKANEEQDVLKELKAANRLCDILNRAILHYAGYTGPVLSAETGQWIEAVSGELYHVPVIPKGPTLEIKQETSLPPFSSEEQAAVDALRALNGESAKIELYIEDPEAQFPADVP